MHLTPAQFADLLHRNPDLATADSLPKTHLMRFCCEEEMQRQVINARLFLDALR